MEKLNLNPQVSGQDDATQKADATEAEKAAERVFFGKTKDGAEVYDRAKGSHLHLEGGMTPELLRAALGAIDTEGRRSFKEVVEFEQPIGKQTCVEVGPEDEVVMVYREGRSGQTPMVKNREAEPSNCLTVVLGKGDFPLDSNLYELTTGYVGKGSPKEPWDPLNTTDEERRECEEFWNSHALVYDDKLIDWERTKAFEFMSEPEKRLELMRPRVLRTGVFIDPETLHTKIQPTLEKVMDNPCVTMKFRPSEISQLHPEQLGSSAKIYAVGYGNDGKNEGILVKIEADDPEIQEACDAVKVPYIALSMAEGAKVTDTEKLDFAPLEEPVELTGKYGLFVQDRLVEDSEGLAEVEREALTSRE